MKASVASDWITLQGGTGFPKIIQPFEEYLNCADYSSAQVSVTVNYISNCTLSLETSASAREQFTELFSTVYPCNLSFTATKTPQSQTVLQLNNLMRWKVDGGSQSTWSITFRYSINLKG
jgi:hypothetical protein